MDEKRNHLVWNIIYFVSSIIDFVCGYSNGSDLSSSYEYEKTDDPVIEEVSGEVVTVMESDAITAMQVARDEELDALIATANETINNPESSTEDKNNAYEEMKGITDTKSLEDELEKIDSRYVSSCQLH